MAMKIPNDPSIQSSNNSVSKSVFEIVSVIRIYVTLGFFFFFFNNQFHMNTKIMLSINNNS